MGKTIFPIFPWAGTTFFQIPWLSLTFQTFGDFDMIIPEFPVCIHPVKELRSFMRLVLSTRADWLRTTPPLTYNNTVFKFVAPICSSHKITFMVKSYLCDSVRRGWKSWPQYPQSLESLRQEVWRNSQVHLQCIIRH